MDQQPSSDSHSKQKIDLDHSPIEGQVSIGRSQLNQIQNKIQGSGNWVINFVFNLFGQSNSLSQQEKRNRKNLLNWMWYVWIKKFLKTELYQELPPIEPDLEERLDWVDFPSSVVWETHNQSQQTYSGEELINLLNQLGKGGKLLILGESGVGKTTALVKLIEKLILSIDYIQIDKNNELIIHAQGAIEQPIPVLLYLPNWERKRQSITKWLIQELSTKHNINKKIIKVWLQNSNLLLLLDGLDEVSEEYRNLCVQNLQDFIIRHREIGIVICCRTQNYKELSDKVGYQKNTDLSSLLCFQSAVKISRLTETQIYQCLDSGGAEIIGIKRLLQQNRILLSLATLPLMLSVIIRTFKGDSEPQLPTTNSNEELYENLFNCYFDRMFDYRNKSKRRRKLNKAFPKDKTENYLALIAQKMQQENQEIFFIERMQPSLLKPGLQKWMYRIGVFLLTTFTAWLVIFIPLLMVQEQNNFIIGQAIICGAAVGLWRVLGEAIEPVETLESAWKNISTGWKSKLKQQQWFVVILLFSLLATAIFGLLSGEIKTDIDGLTFLLITLFVIFLIVVVPLLLYIVTSLALKETSKSDKLRNFPNEGINRTLCNALKCTIIGAIVCGVILSVITLAIVKPWNGAIAGVMLGLCVGIYPFSVCIQHLMLRLVLKFRSDNVSIPLRLVQFLDYAEELILIKKVSGGYKFVDPLLQKHFAQKVINLQNTRN